MPATKTKKAGSAGALAVEILDAIAGYRAKHEVSDDDVLSALATMRAVMNDGRRLIPEGEVSESELNDIGEDMFRYLACTMKEGALAPRVEAIGWLLAERLELIDGLGSSEFLSRGVSPDVLREIEGVRS